MKNLTLIILTCFAFSISGCSNNPSENQVIEHLNKEYDYYKIVSLRKTDGQEAEMFGVKKYGLEFEAKYECIKVKTYTCSESDFGKKKTLTGTAVFEKTENGWRIANLEKLKFTDK